MLFFFKQKTAYEMRISDWSSDVCSSDLSVWHLSDWTQPSENMKARAAFDQSAPSAQLTASPAPEWTWPEAARRISSLSPQPTSALQIGRASCRERVCPYV